MKTGRNWTVSFISEIKEPLFSQIIFMLHR